MNFIGWMNQDADAASPPPPSDATNGLQYITGDWHVFGSENYTDEIIDLTGNLFIYNGGNLTFKNVELRMNVTSGSPMYRIEIFGGGRFNVLDSDGNPQTTSDASNITDSILDYDNLLYNASDYRYHITVNPGGIIVIINSFIREVGVRSGTTKQQSFHVDTARVQIIGSHISNSYYPLYVRNNFNPAKRNLLIQDSTVINCDYGITLNNVNHPDLLNTEIRNIKYYALQALYTFKIDILNCSIFNISKNSGYNVLDIEQTQHIRITNSTIDSVRYGVYFSKIIDLIVRDSHFSNFTYEAFYITGYRERNFYFINNTFKDLYYKSIRTYYVDNIFILDNTFSNISDNAFYLDNAIDVFIERNEFDNISDSNFYLYSCRRIDIKNNSFDLYGSVDYAINTRYSTEMFIENNVIMYALRGIYIYQAHQQNILRNNSFYGRNESMDSYGIYLIYTDDFVIVDQVVSRFKYALYLTSATQYNPDEPLEIYFGKLEICTYSVYTSSTTFVNMYNTTFNVSKIQVGNPGMVHVYYQTDVYVSDTKGPVGGALVTASNKTGEKEFSQYSDENGWARNLFILNGTYEKSTTTLYSPYNFSSDVNSQMAYADSNYTIGSYGVVYINYTNDTKPAAPLNLVLNINYSSIELHWDCYVTDLFSYKVYRNNTSGGWDMVEEVTSPLPGVEQIWSDTGNATKMVEFRYKIHHVDNGAQEGSNNNIIIFNDWVIISLRHLQDWNVSHNGSIIVETGGILELQNVTLLMNGTFGVREKKFIEVRPGGTLILMDGDDDNTTDTDQSFINASKVMGTYSIIVREGGTFEMYNSWIQNASYSTGEFDGTGISSSYAVYNQGGLVEIYNSTIVTTHTGVYMENVYNSTVYGTNFINNGSDRYQYGIWLEDSSNIHIQNNTFNQSWNYEVYALRTDEFEISNNSMRCWGQGIYIFDSSDAFIYGNNISYANNYGIYVDLSEDVIIGYNDLHNFLNYGLYIRNSESIIVAFNNLYNSTSAGTGLYLREADDCDIFNNTMSDLSPFADGIYGVDFYKMIIAYNEIIGMNRGIYINNKDNAIVEGDVIIYNNTIHDIMNDGSGIYLQNSNDFAVTNNTIYNSANGILLDNNDGTGIAFNYIYDTWVASLQVSSREIYYHNNTMWDVIYGYGLLWSSDATINNCTILGQPKWAVYVNETSEAYLTNPNFNVTKIFVTDKTCKIYVSWNFDVIIRDQFGQVQPNIFLRVRNIYGTILHDRYTDSSGKVYFLYVTERVQFYDSNHSYTPHIFEASLGSHSATISVEINSKATISVQLGNTEPSAYDIVINPLIPLTKTTLELQYLFTDPETDPEIGSIIKWYRNGVYQPTLDNMSSIDGQYTVKGDFWYCEVTPCDGAAFGLSSISSTAWIYNTKPSVTDISIVPSSPGSLEDLTVLYSFQDDDGDSELGTIFRWYRLEDSTFVLQETTNDPVLNYTKTVKGEIWKVDIEPKDGESSGAIYPSENVTIGNSPPSVADARIIPENPRSNEDIVIDYTFVDVDSDSEGDSKFRWYVRSPGGVYFIMTAFTGRFVPSDNLAKGETWICEIIPSDGALFGESINSSAVVIENSAPVVTDLKAFPLSPETIDELWVEYQYSDRDNDSENDTSFEWLKWTGLTYLRTGLKLKRLPTLFTAKDEIWACEVIPYDGYTYGTPIISPQLKIGNSAPSVSVLSVTPQNPQTLDRLTANYKYFDENGDPEAGSVIKWYKNGIHQSAFDNFTYVESKYTAKGEKWHFIIIPSDGFIFGTQAESPAIEIRNSAPEVLSPGLKNLLPRGDEDLEVDYIYNDPDNDDEIRTDIRWYKEGILQSEFNDEKTIPANATEKDQSWHYQIRVFDGNDTSGFNQSFPVIIRNSRPVIVDFYPAEKNIILTETESLEFGVMVHDMDDDVILYQWVLQNQVTFQSTSIGSDEFLNFTTDYNSSGTYILNVTIQDWGVGSYKIHQEWYVTVINLNREPTIDMSEPASSNPTVREDKTLKFDITASDPDAGDKLSIKWFLDGIDTGSTGNTYTYDTKGYSVGKHVVTATITDGITNVSKSWNVTVEGEGDDLIWGLTWDQWSVAIQLMVIVFTAIFAVFGFFKLRKKKDVMHDYMRQIEAPMKTWQDDPTKAEDELMEVADHIEKKFNDGLVEDLHYFILERQIKENLREIRQGHVDKSFSYLPVDTLKELEKMLSDSRITDSEYQMFLGVLSQSDELTDIEKEKVINQLEQWRERDKKSDSLDSE
jgi:parallel beta-helix repeat protein